MDPVTITAYGFILGALNILLKPLFKVFFSYSQNLKDKSRKKKIKISITGSDSSVKSIVLDSSSSKALSETEIKMLIKFLKEANDAETEAS